MRYVVALCACVSVLLAHPRSSSADTFGDPGFATEVVATVPPFTLVGLAFAPDGRLFVWQKNGVVRVIKNGVLLPTPFVDLSARVNTFDDRGMWGFAFDPNFSTNGFVYVTYTYENAGNPNSTAARTGRLTRITANPLNTDVSLPGSEIVIMGSVGTPPCSAQPVGADCIPSDGGSHTIGEVTFANDGTLLVGVGDGADGGVNDPRPLRAQDLDSIVGKILRINKDGTAPTDNPFYNGTNSVRSKVWLRGVRNPFRFTVKEANGDIWFGDVGWNTWEEVNRGARGTNHGWPCFEGNLPQITYQSAPECLTLPQASVTFPYLAYDRSVGSAVIGGPFYNATLYPAPYRGNFYFADYTGNFIKRIPFDAQNNPLGTVSFATDVAAPVSLAVGPDGMIYYLSFTTGEIRRIRFNGPVAVASGAPKFGYSPLTVAFSSAGSSGGSLSYLWDFGDGGTSTAPNPSHTYTASGVSTFNARLTVTAAGLSSTATVPIVVGSTPPVPTITSPADGTNVLPGQTITFQGSATDPDEGPLDPSALTWTVLLHHNTHVHTHIGGTGAQGSFVVEDHGPIGTFSYEIVLEARDSSGLSATTSVTLPVGADPTPPTAPTNLVASAPSSGQAQLSWTASTDNVGVTAYRVERCQGAGCANFAEVAEVAPTTFLDTNLSGSTSYSYRVAALDASDNASGYSNIATVVTPAAAPLPPGLAAAYSFDTGSGASVPDVSGNGNTGTAMGSFWSTQGRYGGAMSFDGIGSVVRVASSPSLALSSAMTLSGWINPSVTQSGWRTIVQRQTDSYFLNASHDAGSLRPAGGGTNWFIGGPTASPVGAWTHVGLTYDGTMLRLYVNGTEVASRTASGQLTASTSPLWIGGNSPFGEYFAGLIDDVRVYNRALTQAEIQTDLATPLGSSPSGDTTPPTAPTNLAASAVSPTQVNLTWTAATDNVAVTGYRVERCQGTGCSTFTQVGTPTATSFADSPLSAATAYSYRVRAVDAQGNLGPFSSTVSVTTPAATDTTPPTAPTNLAANAVSATQVNLSWTAATDNVAVTGYRVERCQGAGCSTFTQVGTPTTASFNNTGLSAATAYSYRVRAVDAQGNLGPFSSTVSVTTPAATDTTPPTAPTNLAANAVSATQVNLTWTAATDNVAVTGYRVERCQGAGCSTYTQVGTPTTTSFNNTGLAPSTTYRYRVRAVDAAGNLGPYSAVRNATTPAATDTTPPTAPTNLAASAVSATQVNLTWTAATDNVAVTGYRVERCQGAGCSTFTQVGTPTTTSFNNTGLSAATAYSYRVRAVDAAGNLGPFSSTVSATTPAATDTTPPTAPTNLAASAVSPTQVNLTWTAATDNVAVTGYRVERCQGTGCSTFTQVGTPTATSFADSPLTAATAYSYRVRAVDAQGNLGPFSSTASATTQAATDTTPPTAPTNLAASAASATQVNLSWTAATDNVAVTGYRVERCQGAGCSTFTQVGTPTTNSFADSPLSAATAYSYRVRAVDAAGNLGPYTAIASATTQTGGAPPPVGLVAGYSFDTGSGASVPDVSGNGNTGTLVGAFWSTQGRYGGAMSFDGVGSVVRVASSPSIGLSNAMTLSAWINPSATQSGWRTIVQREVDSYFLNASHDVGSLRPGGGGTNWFIGGPTASPVGAWTHVALTYDGTTLRLYVNGAAVASNAASGSINPSSSPLWIGGNSPFGEYFAGLIDDVRVYNRALTQLEIQTDMTTPLGG